MLESATDIKHFQSTRSSGLGGRIKAEPNDETATIPVATVNATVPAKVKKEEPVEDENVIELTDDGHESAQEGTEGDQSNDEDMSNGEDLRGEIEDALAQLDFQGSYALSHTFQDAPNPWLHVDGIGLVGLPLSERDAKAIIAAANQAPYGHGTQTVVNATVRHTWEIEPQRLSFKNPKWDPFINESVLKFVCDGLGVPFSNTSHRCELYKLLLYEPGSHFLPHQDTQKSPNMFATAVIVLPSQFTGGEVTVSHSDKTKVFDVAPNSMLTSVLSWYTDVVHGVAPVISGYRLALSFSLLHTSPAAFPTFPSTDSLDRLRRVLRKWKHGSYDHQGPQCDVLASLLAHQYSAVGLACGFSALKGADAHTVANLRPIALEEGFHVYLGSLEYHISGTADDDYGYGSNPWKRRRYDYWDEYSDSDSECPSMGEESYRTLTVSNVVDLDGKLALGSAGQNLRIEESWLVQENPFEEEEPDDKDYEGYMGNYAGSVDHYYRRTVLILLHGDDQRKLMFAAGGVGYALVELKKVDPSNITQNDRNLASMAIGKLSSAPDYFYGYSPNHIHAPSMLDIAVSWNDLPMWKQIGEKVNFVKSVIGEAKYIEALHKFDFEPFKPILQRALEKFGGGLKDKLNFINTIMIGPGRSNFHIAAWCSEQIYKTLGSTCPLGNDDIPLVLGIAEKDGVTKTMNCVLPILKQQKFYAAFWITLIKALEQKQVTDQPPRPEWKSYAQKCLDIAISFYAAENAVGSIQAYASCYGYVRPADTKVGTAIELTELCLSLDRVSSCSSILDSLVKVGGDLKTKFPLLFQPCIKELQRILPKHNHSISLSPYREFAQHIIGIYLRDILGAKGHVNTSNIRKLGCGCPDCNALDAFLLSSQTEVSFRRVQVMRTHLQRRIMGATDLVTFSTLRYGSPHTLVIQKKPEVVAACTWAGRQSAAREFLRIFGDDNTIGTVIGGYWPSVVKALNGEQPFAWPNDFLVLARMATNSQIANSASSSGSTTTAGQAQSGSSIQAGTKRKIM